MSRNTHRELIRTLRALSPAEAGKVKAYIAQLRGAQSARDEDDDLHASAESAGIDCADTADTVSDALEDRAATHAPGGDACSFWGRRPLHTVQQAQFEPIAALLREALDQRDARRQRFG